MQPTTAVSAAAGQAVDVLAWREKQGKDQVDRRGQWGAGERLACRLRAIRVPPAVVRRRFKRLRRDAPRRGKQPSARQKRWGRWPLLVTNVPAERLSVGEAEVLRRIRWQVELLSKLWKEHGLVDEGRTADAVRMRCAIYAKWIGWVIQHGLLRVGSWSRPERSCRKAAVYIRHHVYGLALALRSLAQLLRRLATIREVLGRTARIDRRRQQPNAYQLLQGEGQQDDGLT